MPKTSIGRSMRAVALVAMFLFAAMGPLANGTVLEDGLTIHHEASSFTQTAPLAPFDDGSYFVGINYCCTFDADVQYDSQGLTSAVIGRVSGNSWIWSHHLTSNDGEVAVHRAATNSSGFVVVTGQYWNGDFTIAGETFEHVGGKDAFLGLFSPEGELLWVDHYASGDHDGSGMVRLTDRGEIISVGHVGGLTGYDLSGMNLSLLDYHEDLMTLNNQSSELTIHAQSRDILIRRFDDSGQLRQIRTSQSDGYDVCSSVIINPDGSLTFAGYYQSELILDNITLDGNSSLKFWTGTMSPEGEWLWAVSSLGVKSQSGSLARLAPISDDAYLVAWSFNGNISINGTSYNSGTTRDVIVAQVENGSFTGSVRLEGTGVEHTRSISSNSNGDAVLWVESTSQNLQVGERLHSTTGGEMGVIALLGEGPEIRWSEVVKGQHQMWAFGSSMNEDGTFAVSGYYTSSADFNGTDGPNHDSKTSFIWRFVIDEDSDGIAAAEDNCPNVHNPGQENLDGNDSSKPYYDELGDACDPDIDGDGVLNEDDLCPYGYPQYIDSTTPPGLDAVWIRQDWDQDGCMNIEDRDDDNDWVHDLDDACQHGVVGWRPNGTNDYDWDGCRDADEDDDDDNDWVLDEFDSCLYSPLGWVSTHETDADRDGCMDEWIDNDRDDDGFNDSVDFCPDEWGNSTRGAVLGCVDSDGDGWADLVDEDPLDPGVFLPPPPDILVPVPPPEEREEQEPPVDPIDGPEPIRISTELLVLGGMFGLVMVAFTMMTLASRQDDVLHSQTHQPQTDDEIETLRDPPL